ncbi:hypothetical protein HOY80DRAFT_1099546 [Tuber brumale]|nr:hypothetical protein HOY80DRAFT_1099546 [Tuber brumale]
MMARYSPLVVWSLLWLSSLVSLSVSQSAWTLDPQKHLAMMYNHMSAMVNNTIYTIGGTAIYWTPKLTPSSIVSSNNNSVYVLSTANSFLRALDLSEPVDFEAEFSDTTEVISELPFEIPHVWRGATWVDQNTIYYWGGELDREPVYMDGVFQNKTREWPDPMKYYTYDLSQPRGSGTWKTVSISEAGGSDKLTGSPAYGEYVYSAGARKGFYLGGVVRRDGFKNKDGSNATRAGSVPYFLSSMVVFDATTNVWKNEAIIKELNVSREGGLVYVTGVGEKGILVRMGGAGAGKYDLISFDTVYIYDIATGAWYRQPTTSKTNTFPESRIGGFCTGAIAAPDKTSFTIYIYGGDDQYSYKKQIWALTMPYFQWLPINSTGGPERGRLGTACHTLGGQLVMVRGAGGGPKNRGDTNGGTYFYDMTNLTWALRYQPSEYRVPKTIYDIIGGNGQGGATITGPAADNGFPGGLGKLFAAAANRTNPPNPNGRSASPSGGGSSRSTGAIAGGVVGGVVVLAAIVAVIGKRLLHRRRGADTPEQQEASVGPPRSPTIGMGGNRSSVDQAGIAQSS